MNKIIISCGLLMLTALGILWQSQHMTHLIDRKAPRLWAKSHQRIEGAARTLISEDALCFSQDEFAKIFSVNKDSAQLAQFCDNLIENHQDGYKISGTCQNVSARFFVKITLKDHRQQKVWQRTIFDKDHAVLQQETITFKERGACHVSD
ncbi:hypothetical protein PE074_05015 [Wohlfahrtiimonas chitiniclastica]|uniref:DUF4440 domain-containing protein n=1 Tax=Wohlfahrtiimonas chitiniclastica TaxID=400946 RepID=A0AB35C097_9GAMM|nr:hypothetical protein [Wohlfahrtiimonas chitiniclastica]KZS23947.1 hypothetical protein BMY_1817 [Wohlfahrtiimonas chitiniclastica]KZX36789.1 hypothetical protein A6V30_07675 [Wohlfahrtiimonas chitiniclastica]MBS7816614.1 hypothetical protein [Wohlfahrtiimonas chitiniclastica]MBS7819461.1 hypothetical protein [Wohlfahrtiimonas chitiniclastica]MBS7821438.1 hypothetical protein [Wohlfahrtiimonas chitiniclastica]